MKAIKFISTVRRMSLGLTMSNKSNEVLPELPALPPPEEFVNN